MPPILALTICIGFIIYVLIIDIKPEHKISPASWIPTVYLLIIGSRPVSTWFSSSSSVAIEDALLEGSPIDRVIYLVLIIAALFTLLQRTEIFSDIISNNKALFLLITYALFSIAWSDYPLVSFKRWVKSLGVIAIMLTILSENEPAEAIRIINRRCVYILMPLSIVLYKYFINIGRGFDAWTGMQTINGISYNKNGLGYLCLTCGVILYWDIITSMKYEEQENRNRYSIAIKYSFLAMIIYLLIKSDSMTSLITLVIGVLIIYLLGFSNIKDNLAIIGILLLFSVSSYALFDAFFGITRSLLSGLGRDATFTGRTFLWNDLLLMKTNPLLGVGFESFWLGDRLTWLWNRHSWMPNQSHNGYIEVYLNLGYIGLLLIGALLIGSYRRAIKYVSIGDDFGRLQIALFIIILIYNITEAAFFRGGHLLWFMFMVSTINYSNMKGESASDSLDPAGAFNTDTTI